MHSSHTSKSNQNNQKKGKEGKKKKKVATARPSANERQESVHAKFAVPSPTTGSDDRKKRHRLSRQTSAHRINAISRQSSKQSFGDAARTLKHGAKLIKHAKSVSHSGTAAGAAAPPSW